MNQFQDSPAVLVLAACGAFDKPQIVVDRGAPSLLSPICFIFSEFHDAQCFMML